MTRKLVLRSEHLAELSSSELGSVVGGATRDNTCNCPDHTYYCATGHAMCGPLTITDRIC